MVVGQTAELLLFWMNIYHPDIRWILLLQGLVLYDIHWWTPEYQGGRFSSECQGMHNKNLSNYLVSYSHSLKPLYSFKILTFPFFCNLDQPCRYLKANCDEFQHHVWRLGHLIWEILELLASVSMSRCKFMFPFLPTSSTQRHCLAGLQLLSPSVHRLFLGWSLPASGAKSSVCYSPVEQP